ncbi:Tricarboxylate/iron carrier [Pyronema domesticum]|uniref:Sidoreflexin n=1 Tax=Pyronema omphalodes (strain CBS 100304) TaxID=1076935 RepID=U4KWV9_PYROM|nr:Tricarboxylate/iron carrier [Pyronema domesticum]CCX05731.1 Similar to Probable mitochondrial transport protein FSF1; acc. no. Q12029 [Pyronema omphalodes CBS 100304]
MSSSIPGPRDLPNSRHDLSTYFGRVRHAADICDPRMMFTTSSQLATSRDLLSAYKHNQIPAMTSELWKAKKICDATLHPDTGLPVFMPLRMSAFIFSNLIVTAGMLQPNLTTRGVIGWQVANQTLNVCINSANANKSSPLSISQMATSFVLAVSASCGVAVGLGKVVANLKVAEVKDGKVIRKGISPGMKMVLGRLVPFAAVCTAGIVNVGLMRGGEIAAGIDVFPKKSRDDEEVKSLGKSRTAAIIAVGETAVSRVLNATPIMVIPPLVLLRLQRSQWMKARPGLAIPVNIALIFTTSVFALPLALGAFPQRQAVATESLEKEFHGRGGAGGLVEFNRGI